MSTDERSVEQSLSHLRNFAEWLNGFFVDRQRETELLMLSALAEEPVLFVGPPGTAKSDLISRFQTGLFPQGEGSYFEYMLTRFTEPSEILGPLDLQKMKEGAYVRRTAGKLPEASVIFLDEIFKANSAILNTLLTILNEGKFYQDGRAQKVMARVIVAASNEIPQSRELDALKDRFILKIPVEPVAEDHWDRLLRAGLGAQIRRGSQPTATGDSQLGLKDLQRLNEYLLQSFSRFCETGEDPFFPAAVRKEFDRLAKTLIHDFDVALSDRRMIRVYKLIRALALIRRGGTVEREDLFLFAYLGNTLEELDLLKRRIPSLLE